ncbi:FAD-binding oxidoreductase [uncultured Jatrophihabitans sp.]|uniref:FAD-binding oxidoreductase n=1 Tax=uncultured Jatrophihabitans sp. TaxID=1610747 RepID=UPI0035CC1BDE
MTTLVPESHPGTDPGPDTTDIATTLRAEVRGRVLTPADDGYAELATPWNVAAASTPVAVVEVLGTADVAATVRVATRHGLDVAVQATGHGAWGYTRPTVLVHTGRLDEVTVDPATRSARVGAGVRWQQVLDAAAPYGLSGLAGSAPDVGVVGYHTGGGLSPVARTYGYASDRVTAFDVVTGDGEIRRATPDRNPALFWALRGGKGALGIVTALEFELLPVAELYGGCLYFDGADLPTVLRTWREWSATLPEQASTSLAVLRLPEMPMVPPPLAGRCTVAVRFAWIGDPEDGARTIAPVQQAAPVILGGTGVLPFSALGSIHADPVDPMPVHERSLLLRELPDAAADTLLEVAGADSGSPLVIVELRLLGGAIAREPEHPSAVCHRDAAFTLLAIGVLAPPIAEATVASAQAVLDSMSAWSDGAVQPNFAASGDPLQAARKYDDATLARLSTLAATYDPDGVILASRAIRAACAARA